MEKKPFHIRLEQKTKEKLKRIAEEEGRTLAELVREALADLIKKRERRRKKHEHRKPY